MRNLIAAALLFFALSASPGCTASRPIAPRPESEMSWGEPVNGLQVGLRYDGYPTDRAPALRLVCAVRNVSAAPLTLIDLRDSESSWRGSPPLSIESDGRRVPRRSPSRTSQQRQGRLVVLPPGQTEQVLTRLELTNLDVSPGAMIVMKLHLQGGSPEMAMRAPAAGSAPRWFGEAYSGPVEFRVP